MDKSWIGLDNRISHEFMTGLDKFLDFAFSKRSLGAKDIYCPCRDCSNRYLNDRATVKLHCIEVGFQRDYKNWIRHGEEYVSAHDHINNCRTNDEAIEIDLGVQDCMRQMVHEAMGMPNNNPSMPSSNLPGIEEIVQSDAATAKFLKLLKDADQALWEGCTEYTKLSFIVELMHWKASYRLADKGFTSLLKIFIRALPKSAKVPNSYREAYKMTADLGFSYKTWDACINHCMLFRNETEKLIKCEICGAARYKQHDEGGSDEGGKTSGKSSLGKKVPMKKVWYFPLKPRLQRLYWSSKTASLMRWHAEERINDGVLRHPADSRTWKEFDEKYPLFANEARNVRLGLASDGFNPFRTMSISHSTWPVVLMPYNLPPWLCMKQPNFLLSVLIQGPKGPGNKIDVYLQPLIDELKELWEVGISTYDASRNELFTLRASLLWTINDFPAYAMLSGWSTKGEYACPCCNVRPQARWLEHGGKFCYIGHRRFLPRTHPFRKDKSSFDGSQEVRAKPKLIFGSQLLKQVENLETEYKIEDVLKKRKREEAEKKQAKSEKRTLPKLCSLEKIFPPSFFDAMEHLPVHLAEEALLAGPIQFRWMYPVERFLLTLKLYVRNRAHPEASIAKAIIAEECMNFCTQYLTDVETKSNRPRRNDDEGEESGRFVGKVEDVTLDYITRVCTTEDVVPERIRSLALGPHMDARRFKSYIINGFRYRIKNVDRRRKTQNCGVMLNASVTSFASRKDNNPIVGDINFYGELIDILEIRYSNSMRFVLFKCDWVDNRTGKMEDEQKFTLVNFNHKLYKDNRVSDEPFILASQAEQVWYVEDPIQNDWKVVMKITPRDNFDMYLQDDGRTSESIPQLVPFCPQDLDEKVTNEEATWVREGVDGMEIETNNTNDDEVEMASDDDD